MSINLEGNPIIHNTTKYIKTESVLHDVDYVVPKIVNYVDWNSSTEFLFDGPNNIMQKLQIFHKITLVEYYHSTRVIQLLLVSKGTFYVFFKIYTAHGCWGQIQIPCSLPDRFTRVRFKIIQHISVISLPVTRFFLSFLRLLV